MQNKSDLSSHQAPSLVDSTGLAERILLEAELLTRNRELRNFSAIRDRIAASGKDADKVYREILAKRDKLAAKLKTPHGSHAPTSKIVAPPRQQPLLNAPIAPANFASGISGILGGPYGFGYSGFVQAGGLTEGVNLTPGQGATGSIETQVIGSPTSASFDGFLTAPTGSDVDPTVKYFWLHTWQVLVPFPPPTGASWLTYRFDAGALFEIFGDGVGQVMCFVSVGETANLSGPVAITTDVGWPVNADLSQAPNQNYNGSYGSFAGGVEVQRTFAVGARGVPAVAVCIGAVAGLPEGSTLSLVLDQYSGVEISGTPPVGGGYAGGRIAYYVQPQPVLEP